MNSEQHVCPHYNEWTLWWTQQEGEKLTCPPDFQHCCLDNPYEHYMSETFNGDGFNWDDIYSDAVTHGLGMEIDNAEDEEMLEDLTAYLDEIKKGIQESAADFMSEEPTSYKVINAA